MTGILSDALVVVNDALNTGESPKTIAENRAENPIEYTNSGTKNEISSPVNSAEHNSVNLYAALSANSSNRNGRNPFESSGTNISCDTTGFENENNGPKLI